RIARPYRAPYCARINHAGTGLVAASVCRRLLSAVLLFELLEALQDRVRVGDDTFKLRSRQGDALRGGSRIFRRGHIPPNVEPANAVHAADHAHFDAAGAPAVMRDRPEPVQPLRCRPLLTLSSHPHALPCDVRY